MKIELLAVLGLMARGENLIMAAAILAPAKLAQLFVPAIALILANARKINAGMIKN